MNKIVTIGREFGSGGRELGKRIAEKLGIAYYDQEIITEIAKRTTLSEQYVKQISERKPIMSYPIHVGHTFSPLPYPLYQQSLSIYTEQHKLLKELADKSDCVIVGRCADTILRDEHPLRIFVYASMESRIRRCMERKGKDEMMTETQMKKRISEIDKERAKYYQFYSEQKWGARENYDLMVNTTGANIEHIATVLSSYIKDLFA